MKQKKAEYKAKRAELVTQAEQLQTENKFEDSNKIMDEIKQLDTDFDAACLSNANLEALKDKTIVADFSDKTVDAKNLKSAGNFSSEGEMSDTDVYKNAFAKTLMGKTLDQNEIAVLDKVTADFKNAVQTTTINEHAVLIPETVKAGIWKEMGEAHPILADLEPTFVKGYLTIIKDVENSETAEVLTEDDAATEGSFGTAEVTLTGCEVARCITVSWSMKKMSIDEFLSYIQSKIAEKMGNALANLVVNGKGRPSGADTFKAQPKGIVTALKADGGQLIKYSASDALTYKKLTLAMGKQKSGYLSGSAFYAQNTTIWNEIANIEDASGRKIFVPDATSGGVGRVFGVLVKEEDAVGAGEILLANVKKGYALNENEPMSLYQEDHVKARTTDYLGYAIVDGDILTTKAFVLIQKSISPMTGDANTDGVYTDTELNALTVPQLKAIADSIDLQYASNISKTALVASILDNQG